MKCGSGLSRRDHVDNVVDHLLFVREETCMTQSTLLPHIVDAIFAAVSAIVGIGMLHWLEALLHLKLFDSKMLSSIVIFCSNPIPPSPKSFVICTACSFVAGIVLHFTLQGATQTGNAVAVGFTILLSKLSSHNFSPAVGVAVFVATNQWKSSLDPVSYLVTPWLAGHCLLYLWSLIMAKPRKSIRVRLAMREWRVRMEDPQAQQVSETVTRARLKELFTRCDTSGDGRIDATEFKVAYRLFSSDDLPLNDCAEIIRGFDANGSGTIEFEEFCEALAPFRASEKKTKTS